MLVMGCLVCPAIGAAQTAPILAPARPPAPLSIATHIPPAPRGSDVDDELTLDDFTALAMRNNPTLAAARARLTSARGQRLQAGLYPNPVIGYHATEVGNVGTAGQQGGFVSQRIITAGKLQLDQAIASQEVSAAHHQFYAQELRVLSDIRIRFYEALVAQRRVELTQKLAQIGDDLEKSSQTLLDNGQASANDLLQSQIRADEAHILYDNASNESEEAWRRLTMAAGSPEMAQSRITGDLEQNLPPLDWEQHANSLLARHPLLQAARARVDRARVALIRSRREPIPNVDVSVSVRHHTVTDSDVANIQVGVPIPILNRNQGNIRSAEAEWIAACKNVERLQLELQDRLAVAFRRYSNARQQVERYQARMVPRAEKSLQLVTRAYDQGQAEYLTLLLSQQTYVQVSLSYLDSLRQLYTASALIDGQLLSGSLTAPQ